MADVWKFNYATKLWRKISKKSDHIHKTAASACCAMLPGQTASMLVYGGTVVPWGKIVHTFTRYDSVYCEQNIFIVLRDKDIYYIL